MDADFSDIDIGFVVNLKTLREVLKTLSIGAKHWWIASDPTDAGEIGYLTIGYGDSLCSDRLNTISFNIPVLGLQQSRDISEGLVLLLDSSTTTAVEPGFYFEGGRIKQDGLEDFVSFWEPIELAVVDRLTDRNRP